MFTRQLLTNCRNKKGYLKTQVPYSIIYLESESDVISDLPSVETTLK